MRRLFVAFALCSAACAAQSYEQRVATALATVDGTAAKGPYRPSWESLVKYRFPTGTWTPSSASSSTGASTRCRPSATSGTRAACTSQESNEFKHHVATYGPQSQFGYKDFIPQFKAEKFDAGRVGRAVPQGRGEVRRAGGRASRRLPDVRLQFHRLVRREDGAEARRRRRAGHGGPQGGTGLRRFLAPRRALVVLTTAA